MIGEHVDVEGVVSFKDLMHKLGCENIEAKRFSPKLSPDFRANYLMNSRITGLEDADLLLLVGVNPKLESPVLNARIRRNVIHRELNVGLIGTGDYQGYDYEHLGNSSKVLKQLADGSHPYCKDLQEAKLPIILVSPHTLKRPDGEHIWEALQSLSKQYGVISEESNWNGLGVLHQDVGTISALEVGVSSHFSSSKEPKLVYLLGADNFRPEEIPDGAFVIY